MKFLFIILCVWNIIMLFSKKRKKFPRKIKFFNLGSSHSYVSFNYENNKTYANLAEHSQTLYYDNLIFNHVYNNIEKGATCFLTLSYFSFAGKERWLKNDVIKYYRVLKLSDFKGIEKIECFICKYLPIIWSLRKKFLKKENKILVNKRIEGHVRKLKDNKNKTYNLEIIENILTKCKEKQIKVIFITTPFTKYYNSFFTDELLEKNFYNIIYDICKKYNIKYIDFSHDYENFDEKECFSDFDHLNEKGSIVFMRELKKHLEKRN